MAHLLSKRHIDTGRTSDTASVPDGSAETIEGLLRAEGGYALAQKQDDLQVLESLIAELRQSGLEALHSSQPHPDGSLDQIFGRRIRLGQVLQGIIKVATEKASREALEGVDLQSIPKWENRHSVNPGLNSLDWFKRYWEPLFSAGLVFQEDFRRTDPALFNVLHGVTRNRGMSISEIAPSKHPRRKGPSSSREEVSAT